MPRKLAFVLLSVAGIVATTGVVVRALADEWRAPSLVPQRWGWRGPEVVWTDPALRSALTTSVVVAVAVAVIALPLAWPAARAIAGTRRPSLVLVLIALPLLVPGYAVGTGLAVWLLRLGITDGPTGIAIAHLPFVLAYEVLVLVPAFDRRVTVLEEAAVMLGARPLDRLRLVTVPAVAAAVASAAFIGFTVSLTQYGTTLLVGAGTVMLPLLLVPFAQSDPQVAATLALLMAMPAVLALGLVRARRAGATLLR